MPIGAVIDMIIQTLIQALSDPGLWIAAFAGGAFGAALGALPAFIFCGFMIIAGEAASVLKAELVGIGVAPADALTVGFTGNIAFGPVFGPHISFAGGVAATAYAARKGYMDTGFDYYDAKNISHALGTKPDVLAVGGLFGVFGMIVKQVSAGFALPWDPIAMGVVLSAVFHRLILGYPLIGSIKGKNIFDMTPFEREEMHTTAEGGEIIADGSGMANDEREGEYEYEYEDEIESEDGEVVSNGGETMDRFLVEPWLPHQYRWANVTMLGLVVGILGGYLVLKTGSVFLGFGISAATLVFLNCGVEKIPVTHHITLPASTAAVALAGGITSMSVLPSLAIAAVFGISGALTGEIVQRTFYAHGDTHFDPPATAIAINTFFIAVLFIIGVFPGSSWVPIPGWI
jgi:hypothetical protein